jgi:hypothetical protein
MCVLSHKQCWLNLKTFVADNHLWRCGTNTANAAVMGPMGGTTFFNVLEGVSFSLL